MKTRHFLIVHNQLTKPLCEKLNLLFSLFWLRVLGQYMPVRTMLSHLVHARVLREVTAGLSALKNSVTANNRVFVGLGLMGVVSPLSACFYMLFDRGAEFPGWYHVNYFHLFFLLGPHLFELFCLMGAFLLFPQGSKRAYVLIIPIGYIIAKIIWLILANSNQDFWAIVPMSIVLIGMLIGAVLLLMIDWFAHYKFHGIDSFNARFETLANGADLVDDNTFKRLFLQTMKAKREFYRKY
jgi:hypothetical protein